MAQTREQLSSQLEAIEATWREVGTADAEKHAGLESIRGSTAERARQTLNDALETKERLGAAIAALDNELRALSKVHPCQPPPTRASGRSAAPSPHAQALGLDEAGVVPEAAGSLMDQHARLEAARRSLDPQLAALAEKAVALQVKAGAFCAKLRPYEPVGAPAVAELLAADLGALFTGGVSPARSVPAHVDAWEAHVRALAVRVAEVQSSQQHLAEAARAALRELGLRDPAALAAVARASAGADAASLNAAGPEVGDAVRRHLLAPESPDTVSRTHDAGFVACLQSHFAAVAVAHAAMDGVAARAETFLESWFVAVHKRLVRDSPSARLGRDHVAALVSEVDSCLTKTRAACQESTAAVQAQWEAQRAQPAARVALAAAWLRAAPRGEDLTAAAGRIRTDAALDPAWLAAVAAELDEACREAENLDLRMGLVQEATDKLAARTALQQGIAELDQQLGAQYAESAAFEQHARDPGRLQDRTGKGRKDLANEETQRKQFQKSIRKISTDLQRALAQWEQTEHEKFDAGLLSDFGVEVRNAKSEATISAKTQLMHLESSMQVGSGRRVSGEERRASEEQSDGRATPPQTPSAPSAHEPTAFDPLLSARGPKAQKSNPFAKMMTARKSMAPVAFAPNRSLDGEGPKVVQLQFEVDAENVAPIN